jgi:hypothetical protein
VDGYIAGVTNPMFATRYEWWDLLCVLDLPSNQVRVYTPNEKRAEDGQSLPLPTTPQIDPTATPSAQNAAQLAIRLHQEELVAHESMDMRFIQAVVAVVTSNGAAGMSLGEDWVKQQFYDYTNQIVLQSIDILYSSNKLINKKSRRNSFRSNLSVRSIQKSYGISDKTKKMFAANAYRARLLAESMLEAGIIGSGGKSVNTSEKATASISTNLEQSAVSNTVKSGDGDVDVLGVVETTVSTAAEVVDNVAVAVYDAVVGAGVGESLSTDTQLDNQLGFALQLKDELEGDEDDLAALSSDSASCITSPASKSLHPLPRESHRPPDGHTTIQSRKTTRTIIQMYILRLMYETRLHPVLEVQIIYSYILEHGTNTEEDCQALVVMLPESMGGLGIIANGFFHSNPSVRYAAVQICQRMELYESTRGAVNVLNGFYVAAMMRLTVHIADGSLIDDALASEAKLQDLIQNMKVNNTHATSNHLKSSSAKVSSEGPGDSVKSPDARGRSATTGATPKPKDGNTPAAKGGEDYLLYHHM